MQTLLIILLLTTIIVVVAASMIILKKLQQMKELQLASQANKAIDLLNENLLGMHKRMDTTTNSLNERLDNAARVIGQVKHELGGMQEIGRSMKDFQMFLKSPKVRGNLGETILYDTLKQVLSPNYYAKQQKFEGGQMVDAVIKTSGGMIPIDSKFPMESFQRHMKAEDDKARAAAQRDFVNAVKKHIRDIAKKYILPQEGTVDFAVMYVPSEAVYLEILEQHEDLDALANGLRVYIVSPKLFSYFLKIVLIGIERAQLNERAKQVWEVLKGVQKETEKFGEGVNVLAGHITRTKNSMDSVMSEYTKLSARIDQIKLLN